MSEPQNTNSKRRWVFWGFAIPITIGLMMPAYFAWVRVKTAESLLAEDQKQESQTAAEHGRWSKMADEREVLQKQISTLRQDLVAAMKSFSRDELHEALARGIKAANPGQAIVLTTSSTLWGTQAWVWLPEPDHQLTARLTPTDLLPEDVVGDEKFELNLKLDLPPRQLHKIDFEIEERRKSDDCVVRLSLNGELHFERTLRLDPYNSRSRSSTGEGFKQPRVLSTQWAWNDTARDDFQRGIWHTLESEEIGLRTIKGGKSQDKGDKKESRTVKIACHLHLATTLPLYAPSVARSILDKKGLQWEEVDDVDSDFHGLLRITGLAPVDEPAPGTSSSEVR